MVQTSAVLAAASSCDKVLLAAMWQWRLAGDDEPLKGDGSVGLRLRLGDARPRLRLRLPVQLWVGIRLGLRRPTVRLEPLTFCVDANAEVGAWSTPSDASAETRCLCAAWRAAASWLIANWERPGHLHRATHRHARRA